MTRADMDRLRTIAERVISALESGHGRATRIAIGDFERAVTPETVLSLLDAAERDAGAA